MNIAKIFSGKLLISLMLILLLSLSFASCGDGKDSGADETTADTKDEVELVEPELKTMDYANEDLTKYVTVGDYKGFSAEVEIYDLDDEYINEQLNDLLLEYATNEQITDRKTADGDAIIVDFEGALDGVPFAGGAATNAQIEIKEDSGYIPGFVEGMKGMMPGETKTYDVTFPTPYANNPDLAGKVTQFTVTVKYIIGEPIIPALTDEFVKTNYSEQGVTNVDEFMVYYTNMLEDKRTEVIKDNASSDVWRQIMAQEVELISVPEEYVDSLYESYKYNYSLYARDYGMTYEEFLTKYVQQTDEEVYNEAKSYIIEDCVIYSIVKAENLWVTEEEYDEEIVYYCDLYEMDRETLEKTYKKDKIMDVIQWNKLMDNIYEWSDVTVVSSSEK